MTTATPTLEITVTDTVRRDIDLLGQVVARRKVVAATRKAHADALLTRVSAADVVAVPHSGADVHVSPVAATTRTTIDTAAVRALLGDRVARVQTTRLAWAPETAGRAIAQVPAVDGRLRETGLARAIVVGDDELGLVQEQEQALRDRVIPAVEAAARVAGWDGESSVVARPVGDALGMRVTASRVIDRERLSELLTADELASVSTVTRVRASTRVTVRRRLLAPARALTADEAR